MENTSKDVTGKDVNAKDAGKDVNAKDAGKNVNETKPKDVNEKAKVRIFQKKEILINCGI